MKKFILILLLFFPLCVSVQKSESLRQSDDFIKSQATDKEKISFLRNVIADQDNQLKDKDKRIAILEKDNKNLREIIKDQNDKLIEFAHSAGFTDNLKIFLGIAIAGFFLYIFRNGIIGLFIPKVRT